MGQQAHPRLGTAEAGAGASGVWEPLWQAEDAQQVLEQLIARMRDTLSNGLVTCMWVDEEKRILTPGPGCEALPPAYRRVIMQLPFGRGACGLAVQERRLVVVEDTHADPLWAPFRRWTDVLGVRAVWSVPIGFSDRIYATYAMYMPHPGRPAGEQVRWIRALADHAGAALAAVQLRRRERQLAALNEALRDAQRMARIGTWEADVVGGISRWTAETAAIFGLPPVDSEVSHAFLFDRIHPADRESVRAALRALSEQGIPLDLEYRIIRLDGEQRLLHTVCRPRVAPDGRLYYRGTLQDITDRRRLETQARLAETLASIGRVATSLADEIFNPLTTVRGFLQMWRDGHPPSGDALQLLLDELDNIESSVGRILELTAPVSSEEEPVPVADWVSDALAAVEPLAKELGVRLVLDRCMPCLATQAGHSVHILGDRRRLHLALMHVLRNAVEASSPGAEVWVRCSPARLGPRAAWCVTVQDAGVGMPPQVLERVGETPMTTKPQRAGIGLAAARNILTQHGGSLNVVSAPQVGTTVTLTMPLMQSAVPSCHRVHEPQGGRLDLPEGQNIPSAE